MNGPTHALVGAAVGGIGCYLVYKFLGRELSLGEIVLSAGVGVIVASLPDILEPAVHPNHRDFFHSVVFNGLVAFAIGHRLNNPTVGVAERIVLSVVGSAYLSHPMLDAMTPKGLPLI